jgi:hypothetical protein
MWSDSLSLTQLRRRLRTGHQLPPRTTDNQRLLELLLHFFGFSPEVALSRYVLLSLPHSTLSHTHTALAKVEDLRRVRKKWFFGFSYLTDNRSVLYFFFLFCCSMHICCSNTVFFFFIYYVYFLLMIINLEFFYFFIFFLVQVDLVGGYYDAGDNMKYGLPRAYRRTKKLRFKN